MCYDHAHFTGLVQTQTNLDSTEPMGNLFHFIVSINMRCESDASGRENLIVCLRGHPCKTKKENCE